MLSPDEPKIKSIDEDPPSAIMLLKDNDFAKLFSGALTSSIGSNFSFIAVLFLAIEITKDQTFEETAQAVALVVLVQLVPSLLMGPFAGVLVDRFDRKKIMVFGDFIGAGTAFSYLLVSRMDQIYLIAITAATTRLFFFPARGASIPKIAGKRNLVAANGLFQTVTQLSTLIGPALAGIVIGFFGLNIGFIIDGISFIISGVLIAGITQNLKPETDGSPVSISQTFQDLIYGFSIVKNDKVISFLLVTFSVVFIGISMVNPVFAIYLTSTFGLGEESFGFLVSFSAISGFITALILTSRGKIRRKLTFILLGGLLPAGIGLGILAFAPILPYSVVWLYVGMAVIGVVNVAFAIPLNALIQTIIENEDLGKVNGILSTVISLTQVGGAAVASYLVTFLPISVMFAYLAGFITLITFISYFYMRIKKLEDRAINREEEVKNEIENLEDTLTVKSDETFPAVTK